MGYNKNMSAIECGILCWLMCYLFCIDLFTSVASERNQHCGGEVRPKRPKLNARRAEPGPPAT